MIKPDLSEFRTNKKFVCITGRLIATLSTEDKDKIQAAFQEDDISTVVITTWLENKTNQKASDGSVRKHRKGECGCDD